jgi:hypothetical protein
MLTRLILTTTGVDITPEGVNVTATRVRYITTTRTSLRLFLPDLLFSLFLDVFIFCHEYHLLLFRRIRSLSLFRPEHVQSDAKRLPQDSRPVYETKFIMGFV